MSFEKLKIGVLVKGPMLPEPIQIVLIQPLGSVVKIGGKGLYDKDKYYERILDKVQISQLQILPAHDVFNGNAERFRLGIEAIRLALAYEYDPYFSLSVAKVDPVPHQLEAVYDYMLPLPRIRFLLADDAGAGKTIMAGLLLKELKFRGLAKRTLIVTPANLMFQWQRELWDKFKERFEILRGVDLRAAYGINPWLDKDQVVTSIDWAKREEVKESLSRARWDLIIVDEAHKLSAPDAEHPTERYKLARDILSENTDHLLFLTATPHKGDPEHFCLFLRLLDKDVYGDVKSLQDAIERSHAPFYLRRTKDAMVTFPDPVTGEVRKIFTKRIVKTVTFDLDEEEYEFYDRLTKYVEDQSIRAAKEDTPRARALGFTMALLQRRFASSIYAVRRTLERRYERLKKQLESLEAPPVFEEKELEELEDLPEEEATKLLEKIEKASLPTDRESIRQELGELRELINLAKSLEKREVESKLTKLHELLKDQNIFGDQKTKLLIFTEHRDTLEYLVKKLREWGLKVTYIHGGMKVGDRDTPGTRLYAEREFRESAQVLVATEAAGEGINLQFCWMMINYDIPWNPMRLEQRIGRIHRYGQEHDCFIFNFVASNTREGQVLERLLERLEIIRRDLQEDKVYDVIGEIFPANLLERLMRDLYARKITFDSLMDRVVREVDVEKFKRICRSALEGLAKREINLPAILGKHNEAIERRLVPEVVQKFFLEASPLVGINPKPVREGVFRIGKIPRSVRQVAERLEKKFGKLGKEYKLVTFDKKLAVGDVEWVTPGHPLFEAVREAVLEMVQEDLQKGAVFYDLNTKEPYCLDVYTASIKDGRGRTIHQRLFVVQSFLNGNIEIRQPTPFLDLIPATAENNLPDSSKLPEQETIEGVLIEKALNPFLEEVSRERKKEIEIIKRHVELSLNTLIDRQQHKIADLIERQQRGEDVSLALNEAEKRLDELNERLERRREELEKERHLTIGDLNHIGRAWVLPHPERNNYQKMVKDEEIEKIAMEIAMKYEREKGRIPEDVSKEDRGYDILSKNPETGEVRFIEVKGRAKVGGVAFTKNEYETAKRLADNYWLYVVFNCADNPQLILIHNPAKLNWEPVVKIEHYRVDAETILKSKSGEER